jgi:serine/threonine protein phosphatase 1
VAEVMNSGSQPQRLIAIGDLHGQRDMLRRLLNVVQPTAADRLVFLGDYIDRGPDSCGLLSTLIALQQRFPDTVFLRGNHDQMLLDALVEVGVRHDVRLRDICPRYQEDVGSFSDVDIFYSNGGRSTLASYETNKLTDIPQEHVTFLEHTRLWWLYDPFLFIHAGVQPGIPVEKQSIFTLLWARNLPPSSDGTIQVVGHSPTPNNWPTFDDGRYAMDTGAGHNRLLTACDVLTREVWQVS